MFAKLFKHLHKQGKRIGILLCFLTISLAISAQETTEVTGRVVDNTGDPLPGVAIRIANIGTQTDVDGNFVLNIPPNTPANNRITFTMIGMRPVEEVWRNRTRLYITLYEDAQALDEVVVTGILNLNVNEMVGSSDRLNRDDIVRPGITNADELLEGMFAGLQVTMGSMRAGATPSLQLRGQSTLLGNTQPLWVVDGIIQPPVYGTSGMWPGAGGSNEMNEIIGSQISWLNPEDIETITILRDASATAIYGARASNGVIVITTRRGQADRLSIRASYNITVREQFHYGLYNLMNSQERINFSREAFNQGVFYQHVPFEQPYTFEGLYNMFLSGNISQEDFIRQFNFLETVNTNWFDLITRTAIQQTWNVNVSGGTQRATYRASIGYTNDLASEIGNNQQRFTGRMNINVELHRNVRLDASINHTLTTTTGFSAAGIDPIGYAVRTSRAIPAFNQDGSLAFHQVRAFYQFNDNTRVQGIGYNILEDMANAESRIREPMTQANLNLRWELTPSLTWQSVVGLTTRARHTESWLGENSHFVITNFRGYHTQSPEAMCPLHRASAILQHGGILITDHTNSTAYNLRTQLNFQRTFNQIHRVTTSAAWEISSSDRSSVYNTVFGYDRFRGERIANPTPPSELRPIGDATPPRDYYTTFLQLADGAWRSIKTTDNFASLVFIGAYTLKGRYVMNFNFRNDWSNAFGQRANRRFNPAWSIGGMWRLSEEPFMENTRDWLWTANVRLTYGLQGNIANTQTTGMTLRYLPIHPVFRDPVSMISRIANPYITWERTQNWNGGLDVGFFRNRLTLSADGYTRLSNVNRAFFDTAEQGGFNAPLPGTFIRNTGVEGTINVVPIQTNDWTVSLRATTSRNWNRIVREEFTDRALEGWARYLTGNAAQRVVPGYPVGAFWAFPFTGPHPEHGIPTFYFFRRLASDYTEEENARHPLEVLRFAGTNRSDITGGLQLRIAYRNLSISNNFAFVIGGHTFLPNPFAPFGNGNMPEPTSNLNRELLERWTPTNRDSNMPGLYIVPNRIAYPFTLALPRGGGTRSIYSMWANSDARIASLSTLHWRTINLNWQINRRSSSSTAVAVLEAIAVNNITVSASANNILLLADSRWQGMDPRMGGTRKAPRSFTMGVNLDF